MAKVTKNKNGTFTLAGLTKAQLFYLTNILGRTAIESQVNASELYNALFAISNGYPEYRAFDKSVGYQGSVVFDFRALKAALTPAPAGLKWVAYFTYPSSAWPHNNVRRAVVTELNHPNELGEWDDITGVDKSRNAYRRFKRENVVGHVTWVQEKA